MPQNSVEVLLVEDNATDAELTIRELKRHRISNRLYHVRNGEDALAFIFATGKYENTRKADLPPKLILLDIQMPRINGIEVLQKLKSNDLTKTIPVVMLTSSKEDPDVKTCYQLGANSYLVKPVDFEGFSEAIKNIGFYWLILNQSLL